MSPDTDGVATINSWLSGGLALLSCLSSFTLSLQRAHLHKTQNIDPAPLRFDDKRDPTSPFADDSNRLARITYGTLALLLISTFNIYEKITSPVKTNDWMMIASYGAQFIAWLYAAVLAMLSRRYRFPNKWGWILNVHLFLFYLFALCISIYNIYEALALLPGAAWVHMLPTVVGLILTIDLVYTTATCQREPTRIDARGRPVIGVSVASICSYFYFQWATPLIQKTNNLKSLKNEDLPALPPLFRGHNIYYIFGRTRGQSLLKRIYLSNRPAIIMQVILAIGTSLSCYAPAYFVNQLLRLIQTMNGEKDPESLRKGFAIVISLGVSMFALSIAINQLWFYSIVNVQTRIKPMLNIEIYRKALLRCDVAIKSPKIDQEEEKKADTNADVDRKLKKNTDNGISSSTGAIVNLMSTDSSRISDFSEWWISIISAPIELAVGIYFLYNLLGKSCFLGLLVMVVILPMNHFNAKIFAKTQDRLMEARDKRVNLMNEVLQGIRQIKFFAWEKKWEERIMESRDVELHHLGINYICNVLLSFLWQSSPILVTLISFYSFTKLEGKDLTAPVAFTAIAVFNELRSALYLLPKVIIEWLQALISIRRIEAYLDEEEIDPPSDEVTNLLVQNRTVEIEFVDATVGWSKQNYTDEVIGGSDNGLIVPSSISFILKDVTARFPKNELSLISGATGSGKTLLMLSLLGEAVVLKGSVQCPRQAVADTVSDDFILSSDIAPEHWILPYALAYVSQTAWLQNASIRNNILFGLPYVESRYNEILYACALIKDLEILGDGDQTEIGEKGITLSGGQKARVSLARAVYSRAQNVLMDDVLSAVDAHTAKHLYEKCLLGPLMKDRTRILITHHVKLCVKGSGYIVHVDNGRTNIVGTPSELRQSGQLDSIFESKKEEQEDTKEEEAIEATNIASSAEYSAESASKVNKKPRALVEEEGRATGGVETKLYTVYARAVGSPIFWLGMAILILGSRSLDVAEGWWLKQWSQSYEKNQTVLGFQLQQSVVSQSKPSFAYLPLSIFEKERANHDNIFTTQDEKEDNLNFYLGIYCFITVTSVFISTFRFGFLYWGALRANKSLYANILHRVFRAPLRFFDTTPIGRILNRFSKDFETIDSKIPSELIDFTIQWVMIISSELIVSTVLPVFLIPMLIVVGINIWFGVTFLYASRELNRMDSVSRSPLFSNFTETIVGVATIRAFGATQMFLQDMLIYVDNNTRPLYFVSSTNRWISVRIAFTSAIISTLTAVIILLSVGRMNASLAGFCLSFGLSVTDDLLWGVRKYGNLEMSFNAVERVVEFMEIDQEAPSITQLRPPTEWPSKGSIEVKDLEIRYAADLDPVLKGLTFSVKAQEKIGIVGRTGSGKSTLALSFYRFVEATQGSIVIDGINIADLGTEDLRSNLTIIPQDPTLFSGSLRSNMDPFDQFKDEDIFVALRRVQLLPQDNTEQATLSGSSGNISYSNGSGTTLADTVNLNVFKNLDTIVTEGGKNFSQGQRQLLCLARALLKRSRIVLMDEATASVDFETDKAIQKTIYTEFVDSTILCIAHRLHTVIEYDRILVLDQGEIIEFDSPLTLINNSESAFYKMCKDSGEFDGLIGLAKSKHELVDI